MSDIQKMRRQFRVALPESDGYVFKLGVAIYSFASANSFLCEIIATINPEEYNHTILQDKTSGKILKTLKGVARDLRANDRLQLTHDMLDETAAIFERLNNRRNDIFHAYPITGEGNAQILHRRKDASSKYFEIKEEILDRFIYDAEKVSDLLYRIRDIVSEEVRDE